MWGVAGRPKRRAAARVASDMMKAARAASVIPAHAGSRARGAATGGGEGDGEGDGEGEREGDGEGEGKGEGQVRADFIDRTTGQGYAV